MVYDPRPPKFRNEDNEAVSQLYESLAQLGTPCGFIELLEPVVAEHVVFNMTTHMPTLETHLNQHPHNTQ